MYLLYLDESGNPDDPADHYFVMAGIAIFERTAFFLASEMDKLQSKYFPSTQPLDFHTSPIRSGKGFWRHIPENTRKSLLQDIMQLIATANEPGVKLFAAAVEKDASLYGENAVKAATEQVCKRFDTFLVRRATENDDKQRGLLVFAESHYQQRAKLWVRGFRELGTQWGILYNLSDIPYFAPAKESRFLQLADFVAHATFLLYERRITSLAKGIIHRFDQKAGIVHGLSHVCNNKQICDCPACYSRRTPHEFGPWL